MNTVKIKYCIDELKYHICGLFPFFAKSEDGNLKLYKGNSLPDGCFNQISCNLILPCDLTVNDRNILASGKSYSYATLKHYYQLYKGIQDNPFIQFIEHGIGLISTPHSANFADCDLIPDKIYLSECVDLYDEMTKMKILIDNTNGNPIKCDIECLIDKYKRMGGDEMRNFYYLGIKDADAIATDLYENYADPTSTCYSLNLCVTSTVHDIGLYDNYVDTWSPYSTYYKGDIIMYNGDTYVCNGNIVDGVDNGVTSKWDATLNEYTFNADDYILFRDVLSEPDDDNNDIVINGSSNSKLKTFRKFGDYISITGEIETPNIDEDWLYYYKIGALAAYSTIRDDSNNIDIETDAIRVTTIGEYEQHLMAYGDILTDIKCDTGANQITFQYVIGAHLKAKLTAIDIDEFGNFIFKYGDFEYDNTDLYHGVTYTETYEYDASETSEIGLLLNRGNFNDYVRKDIVAGEEFTRAPFNLHNSIQTSKSIINGNEVTFSYIPSEFTAHAKSKKENVTYPLIKRDYYDSVVYEPIVKNNISFSRGNSAAFERHLKLGEVKSFDDFQNYANGGFFNIL